MNFGTIDALTRCMTRTIATALAVALLAAALPGPAHADTNADPAADKTADATGAASDVQDLGGLREVTSANDITLAPVPRDNSRRNKTISAAAVGGTYVGLTAWAYFAWYQDQPANHGFELGGDGLFERSAYAGGSDKLGHALGTMAVARLTSQMLQLGGWDRRKAAIIGGGLSALAFTAVEYADAYYYEFSLGDLGADFLGAGLAVLLETWPRADELFDFRMEYFPSDEYRSILRGDPGRDPSLDIKKVNIAEDYSGQTFLLALHLSAFDSLAEKRWTAPLQYLDAVIGFRSDKYRPNPLPDDTSPPTQHLFIGASLNLQAVVDRTLAGGGKTRRGVRSALHGLTEVFNAPFTSYGIGPKRTCAPPACMTAP